MNDEDSNKEMDGADSEAGGRRRQWDTDSNITALFMCTTIVSYYRLPSGRGEGDAPVARAQRVNQEFERSFTAEDCLSLRRRGFATPAES